MYWKFRVLQGCVAVALGLAAVSTLRAANLLSGHFIANNTPSFVATAKNLGPANPVETIEVSLWLNLRDREALDTLAEELYDPRSSHYHDWLKPADIAARFAPTAEAVRTVEQFLAAHNLPVISVGPDNFVVRARGTAREIQNAFHVQMNRYELNGKVYRSNTTDPYIEGPAAAMVKSVSGLDNLEYQHPLVTQTVPALPSGPGFQTAATDNSSSFFTSNCFTAVETKTFTGTLFPATATYTGNTYNGTENAPGCGYTPSEIQSAYNLSGLYQEGYDGTGQTIVIIDWCGSPTVMDDANAFSARFGLPPLTSSNFKIINTGVSTCAGPNPEINLDVEWAHAIAPGAAIDLVVPPTASFQDVDNAELYAVANGLGNVISGSYGSEEILTPTAVLQQENLINQIAALFGISANFATGDSGDFTRDIGPPQYPASVLAPADSPYATGVGGVSLALNSDNSIAFQTGWGTNENPLVLSGNIFAPPTSGFFDFGSGGGPSAFFSKPSFQSALPGTSRLLPDVSWLADPFTGGVIAITEGGVYPPQQWRVVGGTSLATPMFSALWAIANQEAGVPLGQAARSLYSMPAASITDVLPVGSATNVTGSVNFFGVTAEYSAAQLAAPLNGTTAFYSALRDIPLYQDTTYVITFGTDTGLRTAVGWDNVTGLGTPNAKAFADYFNPGTSHSFTLSSK